MASASIATVPYRPPLATGTPTITQSTIPYNYGTSTAQPGHTDVYLYYFIVPYLDAHVLSPPSWRYAYIFWLFIPAFLVIWTVVYQLNRFAALRRPSPSSHNPPNNALHKRPWNFHPIRWIRGLLIRRLIPTNTSISKRPNRKTQLPRWYSSNISIGQAISLLTFTVVLLALSLVGDDYISPTTCTWGGRCPVQVFNQGPPKSTYAPLSRRARIQALDKIPPPEPAPAARPHSRRDRNVLLPRATALSLNPNGWAPFTDPLLSAPNVDVPRTMWTLSSRFGLIAYAMIPFVVSIGLKSWPFNIFAIPWLTHYGFDRTSIIHRWTGRLIWIWSTIHTITFAIQLSRDINPYGNTLLTDVWQYYRFNWGVVAYLALTITVGFSFNPLRNRYYEFFYCSHVILSILFLVGCIIHYEPLWAWAVIGLALWGAERAYRLSIWLWFNGFAASPSRFWSNHATTSSHIKAFPYDAKPPTHLPDGAPNSQHSYPPSWLPSSPGRTSFLPSSYEEGFMRVPPKLSALSAQIPPGFALVQVLPGQTLRITLRMIKDCKWEIGQYMLLCVPSVSWWQTHPYTICSSSSLSQFDNCSQGSSGKHVVLLLRTRQGFSKQFYESIIRAKADRFQNDDSAQPTNGILTRCQISRPLGSSGRITWDSLDSLVIVCGGSGISFGIAALEETCFKMCTRSHAKTRHVKPTISRVRLVWIFREYAHLSWVAPALKRCLAMVSSEELQIDLYVSNSLRRKNLPSELQDFPRPPPGIPVNNKTEISDSQTLLMPPHPPFLRLETESDFSPSPARNSFTGSINVSESDYSHGLDSQDVPLEFTEFEGEARGGTIAEMMVSANVKDEGKRRRKNTMTRNRKGVGALGGWTKPRGIFGKRTSREVSLGEEKINDSHQMTLVDGGENQQSLTQQLEHSPEHPSSPWKDELMREMGIDLSPHELVALEELSEGIKTGRPRLPKILDEEVDRSAGKTLIACCGPESLNGFMRSLVGQQHLRLIDKKTSCKEIDIYTEDFSY